VHAAQQRRLVPRRAAAVPDDARWWLLSLIGVPQQHQSIQELRAEMVRDDISAESMLVGAHRTQHALPSMAIKDASAFVRDEVLTRDESYARLLGAAHTRPHMQAFVQTVRDLRDQKIARTLSPTPPTARVTLSAVSGMLAGGLAAPPMPSRPAVPAA
jgi:hypothetical protein